MAMQICLSAVITGAKSLQSLMPILNSHAFSQMKVMGLIGFWYWVNKQWGRATNNQIQSFPLAFSTIYVAVCIGYSDINPGNDDGAPRLRALSNNSIKVTSGFNNNSAITNMFIAVGK